MIKIFNCLVRQYCSGIKVSYKDKKYSNKPRLYYDGGSNDDDIGVTEH